MLDRCVTDAADCVRGITAPQSVFYVEALRQLQTQEKISINLADSDIYCTRSGPLLVLSEQIVEKIRSYMLYRGLTCAPSTVEGVIDCLRQLRRSLGKMMAGLRMSGLSTLK